MQYLPIPLQRWISLLFCAITATTITVFLSNVSFVQKAYLSWSSILHADPFIHYSFAFIAGIAIKLLLDNFYISHANRSIAFSWKYPPLTVAVWLSLTALLIYILNSTNYRNYLLDDERLFLSLKYFHICLLSCAFFILFQEGQGTSKMVGVKLWMVLCLFLATLLAISGYYQIPWPLITIFILLYIIIAVLIVRSSNGVKLASIKEYTVKSYSGNDFNNLEDFRAWFKDDSIITCTEQLGPELQVYAKRITERLRHSDKHDLAQAQHIALCGPYGCGKSSIVDSIANELAKSSERDGIWIHSDISTWGAASGSVAHIVLSNIIDDISQHIDMCAFRALPKHYTEALKSGGSWLQFTSTLLAGPVDPEKNFQRLNDVLKATNHKLLITLQDVDRGTDEESKKRLNAIAALLDRLKDRKLKQVNFIVATGYEKPFAAEIISKATDYREDIAKINFRITLASFIKISIDNAKETERVITFYEYGATHERLKLDQINAIINSSRQLKKILRRVDQAWQPTKLMGEINFHSLIMVAALRETNPTYFERYCRADAYLESKIKNNKDDLGSVLREIAQISKNNQDNSLVTQGDDLKGEIIFNYLQEMLDVKREHSGKLKLDSTHDHKQSVGCTNSDIDYLKRILLEQVPDYELRDQDVITIVKEGESNLPKFTAEYQALENSIHEAQYSLFTEKIGSEEQKKYVREM